MGLNRFAVGPIECDRDGNDPIVRTCFPSFGAEFLRSPGGQWRSNVFWGRDVADYFSLIGGRRRVASCLHADTLEETTGILCAPPLHVRRSDVGRLGLVLFMHVAKKAGGYRRRVAGFWETDGQGGHRSVFQWDAPADAIVKPGELRRPEELWPYQEFIRGLVDQGEVENRAIRRRVVEFYSRRT